MFRGELTAADLELIQEIFPRIKWQIGNGGYTGLLFPATEQCLIVTHSLEFAEGVDGFLSNSENVTHWYTVEHYVYETGLADPLGSWTRSTLRETLEAAQVSLQRYAQHLLELMGAPMAPIVATYSSERPQNWEDVVARVLRDNAFYVHRKCSISATDGVLSIKVDTDGKSEYFTPEAAITILNERYRF
jgi:hypothetical protein